MLRLLFIEKYGITNENRIDWFTITWHVVMKLCLWAVRCTLLPLTQVNCPLGLHGRSIALGVLNKILLFFTSMSSRNSELSICLDFGTNCCLAFGTNYQIVQSKNIMILFQFNKLRVNLWEGGS